MENQAKKSEMRCADAVIMRTIDEGYRIVLPKVFREHLFLQIGERVMLSLEGERIMIEKPTRCCRLCGSSEAYDTQIKLCRSCIEKTVAYFVNTKRGN